MKSDRRNFLKHFGGTAAAVITASALAGPAVPRVGAQEVQVSGAAPSKRRPVTSRCLLELDGAPCGWLWWAEGGSATADVLVTAPGGDGVTRKRLGARRYDDLTLFCGASLSQPFYDWVKSFFGRQAPPRTGAVIYLDSAGREVSRLNFNGASIAGVDFPVLDAVWRDPAVLTVRLKPESTRLSRDGMGRQFNLEIKPRRPWLPCNFRLAIGGLEEAAGSVLRIEALSVQRGQRAGALETGDLVVSLPAVQSQNLEAWFEGSMTPAEGAEAEQKQGTLQFLSGDRRAAYFTLTMENLGVYKVEPVLFDAGERALPLLQARMYCENLRFDHQIGRV